MAPALEPEVVKPATRKSGKPRRAQKRYKIRGLAPAVHRELDERLRTGDYRSFEELSDWLEKDHQQFTKLGENIIIRRFTRYQLGEELSK